MKIKKSFRRAFVWLGVLIILIGHINLTANIAFAASSYTETTTTHFNAGTHSSTQTTNINGGEVTLDENAVPNEISIPNPGALFNGAWEMGTIRPKIVTDATEHLSSDGILYATWHEDDNDGTWDDIWFSKSPDGGETWTTPVQVDDGDIGGCQEQPTNSILPDIAVDNSTTPPTIYIVWADNRPTNMWCPGQYIYNVWFSASIDGGNTWSPNIKVNSFPSLSLFGSYFTPYLQEKTGYYRDYLTGGPKVALGATEDGSPILVTWMNDEVRSMDYDVYYSKSASGVYPLYVFDADWTTPCIFTGGYGWPYGPDTMCEDAKIDDNDSMSTDYSGVPSIDADQSDRITTIAYEDQRLYAPWNGLLGQDIMFSQFKEYGGFTCPYPLVTMVSTKPEDLIPMWSLPPFTPTLPSLWASDSPGQAQIFNYEPDIDDREADPYYVYFTWTRDSNPEGSFPIVYNKEGLLSIVDPPEPPSVNNIIYDIFDGNSTGTDIVVNDDSKYSSVSDVEGSNTDEKDAYIVWTYYDYENASQSMFDYTNNATTSGGSTWHTDVKISGGTNGIFSFLPDLTRAYYATDQEAFHVIWTDTDPNDSRGDSSNGQDPYTSRSIDLGASWGSYFVGGPGTFISKAIDLSSVSNIDYKTLSWTKNTQTGGNVNIQLRAADTQAGLAGENFTGSNGNANSYYTTSSGQTIYSGLDGKGWIQYLVKITAPNNFTITPYLYDLTLSYDQGATDGGEGEGEGEEGEGEEGEGEEGEGEEGEGEEGEGEEGEGEEGEGEGEFEEFTDVDPGDSNYDAIMFVGKSHIFNGYPDGSFKPNKVINRAETAKVILDALSYTIYENPGSDFGYPDLETAQWYMKYIFTAFVKQVMEGYPDKTMKPAQTVNRVELLKIFLNAAGVNLEECTDIQAYPDTKADAWYCSYVNFAQLNNLIDSDSKGNLNPSAGMTRGDVAEIFYRYDQYFGLDL